MITKTLTNSKSQQQNKISPHLRGYRYLQVWQKILTWKNK